MDESKPVATPMAMKLHKRKPELGEEACDPTTYQSMIGSLMYAMTTTRPNIAFSMGFSAGTITTRATNIW